MRSFKDFILEAEYRQVNMFTKKGTAQNFTGGRTPFVRTDPVPSSGSKQSSTAKQVVKPKPSPGQMNIPGLDKKSKSGQGGRSIGSTTSRGGAGLIGTRDVPNAKQVAAKYGTDAPAPKPSWKGKGAQTPSSGSRVSVTGRPDAGAQAARVMRSKTPINTGPGANLVKTLSKSSALSKAGNVLSKGLKFAGPVGTAIAAVDQAKRTINTIRDVSKRESPSARRARLGQSQPQKPQANRTGQGSGNKPRSDDMGRTAPTSTAKPTPTPTSTAATKPTPAAPKMTARQKADAKTRATYDKLRASNPELAKKYGTAAFKSRFK